jgi:uncharacterized protein (TIGR02270 family)
LSTQRARYIPELLQRHLEELEYLWGRRRRAIASRELTVRDYADLTERVEAHIQGVLAVPPALPDLVPKLAGDDRDGVFAAACPLLRSGDRPLVQAVIEAFGSAEEEALAGIRDAMSIAYGAGVGAAVKRQLETGTPAHAAAAAVVLANQRLLPATASRLPALLQNDDPAIAESAWFACTIADLLDPSAVASRPFRQALVHESARVRSAALRAAAWTGQPWTLSLAREMVDAGDRVALDWLAALGGIDDVERICERAASVSAADDRCALLARFGHPAALDMIVGWLDGEAADAAAAGAAFTLMTGVDIRGERKTLEPPPDADEFEKEFAADVWLPDAAKARDYLRRYGAVIAQGTRWRCGIDLGGTCTSDMLARVDLEARWDVSTRAALAGAPITLPPPITL